MKSALPGVFAMVSLLGAGVVGCSAAPSEIIRTDAGSTGGSGTGGSGTGGTSQGSGGASGSGGGSGGSGGGSGGSGGSGGAVDAAVDMPVAEVMGETAPAALCTPVGDKYNCNNVLMGMDGFMNSVAANGPAQGSDGIQLACTPATVAGMQRVYKERHWQLTGPGITMGRMYKVNLHFYGVVECKAYVGGTGPARTDPSPEPNVNTTHNLWMSGVRDNGDVWNTYALTVTPMSMSTLVGIGPQNVPLPATENTYVFNQCPGNRGVAHYTYNIDFDTSINVPGGSWINYIEYDTNCRIIVNCGAAEATQNCPGPYNVVPTVTNAVPNTMATFAQPPANTANPPARGQWWLVDVTNITPL